MREEVAVVRVGCPTGRFPTQSKKASKAAPTTTASQLRFDERTRRSRGTQQEGSGEREPLRQVGRAGGASRASVRPRRNSLFEDAREEEEVEVALVAILEEALVRGHEAHRIVPGAEGRGHQEEGGREGEGGEEEVATELLRYRGGPMPAHSRCCL